MNPDEILNALRAAMAPGADPTTKQTAAVALRSLLTLIQAPAGAGAGPGAPAGTDLLGALVEKFRPLLPAEVAASIPRLNIPFVPVGSGR